MENKETEVTKISTEHAVPVTSSGVTVDRVDHTEATSTKELAESDSQITNHDPTSKTSDERASLPTPTPSNSSQANPTSSLPAKTTNYVPPVKRFSAVNINKKFLEKASSSTTPSGVSHQAHSSATAKQNGTIVRPTPQTAHSHSRLVTTKLTASSSSGTTGPGWSRPSSVTPPVPANSASSNGPSANSPASSQITAQVLTAGKNIAPQARTPGLRQKLDGKPAWGNVAQNPHKDTLSTTNDFPTAAEAAHGRKLKNAIQKAAEATAAAHEQAMHDTADAFRGVHLDPNAHHWDEMDEDDNDDYLGEVIEFGDGRQYTIQVDDSTSADPKHDSDGKSGQPMGSFNKEERFADDFDRSWPRNRNEPSNRADDAIPTRPEVPSTISTSPTTTRDLNQSRVLFNERSNRMEPYDGRSAPAASHYRRGGDAWGHTSSRYERDPPPHGSRPAVQVLQKSQRYGDGESNAFNRNPYGPRDRRDMDFMETGSTLSRASDERRSRRYSNTHSNISSASSRERRPTSGGGSRAGDSVNGHLPSKSPSEYRSGSRRDSTYSNDYRQGQSERQLPPHMHRSPQSPSVQLRSTEDTRSRVPSFSSQAPAPSLYGQTHSTSDRQGSALSEMPADADLDDLRKQFLHERAEQARRRREQEEEERAKARERARQKALELEAKIASQTVSKQEPPTSESASASRPTLQVTESQILNVIEDAVKSASASASVVEPPSQEVRPQTREKPPVSNAWAQRALERSSSGHNDGPSSANRAVAVAQHTTAETSESWRKRQSTPSTTKTQDTMSISTSKVVRPTLVHDSPVEQVLNLNPGESVEIVDFSDLGKLVDSNVKDARDFTVSSEKPKRPSAVDFFDDGSEQSADKVNSPPLVRVGEVPRNGTPGDTSKTISVRQEHVNPLHSPSLAVSQLGVPPSPGRILRQSSFREAPLSALDDTMSRIKGVLDGMQSSTTATKADSKDSSPRQGDERLPSSGGRSNMQPPSAVQVKRWVPPALRPPPVPDLFDVTMLNLSQVEQNVVVKLPKQSRRSEPLSKRQFNFTRTPPSPVRWEILSFDPPVEGMTKRSLSVNEILFGKPPYPGRRVRYRVWIPKRRGVRPAVHKEPVGPVGISKTNSAGAFGRPSMADSSTWRQARKLSVEASDQDMRTQEVALDVTSRSPPPDSANKVEEQTSTFKAVSNESELNLAARRLKGPVGMPEGADFAFSRNLNVEMESTKTTVKVNFTVSSELDEKLDAESSPVSSSIAATHEVETKGSPRLNVDDVKSVDTTRVDRSFDRSAPTQMSVTERAPLLESPEIKSPPVSNTTRLQEEPRPVTPPLPPSSSMSNSIWGKSPSRAPDREHLKAVWSQASDKEAIPTVNSLREIADDLPAVPFSIHEAKLDDDGTPPPFVPPARMSASDVTRAFQTVPSGPSGTKSLVPPTFSPTLSPRAPKPAPIGMPPPPNIMNGVRPPYMGYASVQSHSPSPTMMYPQLPQHVMSNQMRGSPSSPYGQPVWMPMQSHAPQQSPQLMRAQPASPYGAPVHQYQPQGGLYAPTNQPHNAPAPPMAYAPVTHQPQRMSLISPVLPAASPVHPPVAHYSSSPMLLHVPPPGVHTAQPYPGAMSMGRGSVQPPVDNRQPGHPMPHAGAPMPYPGHTPAYSHVPPHSFVRPSW